MKPDGNDILWQLIADKMGGLISEEEQKQLDVLLQDPLNRKVYDALIAEGPAYEAETGHDLEKKQQLFKTVQDKIDRHGKRVRIWKSLSFAASLFVCLAGGYAIHWIEDKTAEPELVQYTCQAGGYSSFYLPDSTRVYVNSGSRISYPVRFSGNNREVWLDGEAFFEVSKDRKHPFTVRTDIISVTALGTSFNVRSFSSDTLAVASLVTGLVEFSISDSPTKYRLKPDEQVRVSKKSGSFEIAPFDPAYAIAWKDGNLSFQKARFKEICETLEKKYGYNIIIENPSLGDIVLTGSFVNNESIFQVLDMIKHNTGLKYSLEGQNTIIIR